MNGSSLNTFTLRLAGHKTRISTYNGSHSQTNRFENQNKPNVCLLDISNEGTDRLIKHPEYIKTEVDHYGIISSI